MASKINAAKNVLTWINLNKLGLLIGYKLICMRLGMANNERLEAKDKNKGPTSTSYIKLLRVYTFHIWM